VLAGGVIGISPCPRGTGILCFPPPVPRGSSESRKYLWIPRGFDGPWVPNSAALWRRTRRSLLFRPAAISD